MRLYEALIPAEPREKTVESFVAHAPEKVVALERKKEADSLSKIESLENAIKALKNS
jgi:valyl-tRNA synthetase